MDTTLHEIMHLYMERSLLDQQHKSNIEKSWVDYRSRVLEWEHRMDDVLLNEIKEL